MLKARALISATVVLALVTPGFGRAQDGPGPDPGRIEPGLLAADGPVDVLVRFRERIPRLEKAGLTPTVRFTALPAIAARVTPAALRWLAAHPDLAYLERDKPLAFDLDTATVASRARDVTDADFDPATPPILDMGGNAVDGRGVGIAIVDTGLDGLHPDFDGSLGGNYQVTPAGLVPMTYTSPTSGHGTHVAGIAAGTGRYARDRALGDYRGVAPGATLYGFNMYNATQLHAAVAFQWIIDHGAEQDPPIRVVNNSWHCVPSACNHPFNRSADATPLHIALASAMAEHGITVTWAAGNVRGTGDLATTSVEAINRTPGIIGVANYKDDDSSYEPHEKGRRDGCLSGASAWGASADPTTWPDLAAPGRTITSTWALNVSRDGLALDTRNPVNGAKSYAALTGTSMAAPHVAGIVALLLQIRPSLTPAEIEYILKQTSTPLTGPAGPGNDGCGIAYINADPAHPWTGANYAAGHGLVHAYEAARLAQSFTGIPAPAPDPEPIPDDFIVTTPGVAVDRTLYLVGEDAMSDAYPDADRPRARASLPNTTISHVSPPFADAVTFDAITVDAYVGTSGEYADLGYLGGLSVRARAYHVPAVGDEVQIGELASGRQAVLPAGPTHRDLVVRLPRAVTIDAGDRLRVEIGIVAPPYYTTDPPINAYWLLYTESFTATRVGLGTTVARPDPATRAGCERYRTCAEVDATHPYEGVVCGTAPFRLVWSGPPGSSLVFGCNGTVTVCQVADGASRCETEVDPPPAGDERAFIHPDESAARGGFCTYRLPDGGRGGWGRCAAITP